MRCSWEGIYDARLATQQNPTPLQPYALAHLCTPVLDAVPDAVPDADLDAVWPRRFRMTALAALSRKELRDVLREKSLITAFLIQMLLAGFSALLLAGLTALHSPETLDAAPDASVAYVGAQEFEVWLRQTGNLDVTNTDGASAVAGFRDGTFDAVIQEEATDPEGVRSLTLILADGELETTLLSTQLRQMLIDYETQLRQERSERLAQTLVLLDKGPRSETPYAFVYTTLVPLLVITPVFLSGAIAGDALSQESKTRTLLILRSAPVSPTVLVFGKLLIPVLLVPVQVAVWLGLFWLNGFPTESPGLVLLAATVMGVLLTAAGTAIAATVRNESTTQAAYAVLVLALGVLSLLLPRDPLNLIALLSVGVVEPKGVATLLLLSGLAALSLVVAVTFTRRRIVSDAL